MPKLKHSIAKSTDIGAALLVFLIPTALILKNTDIEIILSFFLLSSLSATALYSTLSKNNNNAIVTSTVLFVILFFLIAPITQITNAPYFMVNTAPFSPQGAALANILISLFLLVFFISCAFFSKKIPEKTTNIFPTNDQIPILTLSFISVGIALYASVELAASTTIALESQDPTKNALKLKILYFIPFVALALTLLSNASRKRKAILFIILITCLLITKNHLTERRNAIGPIYLSILVILLPWIIEKGRTYFYVMASMMLIGFPISSLLTHRNSSGAEEINPTNIFAAITNHFTELHYDAWANLITTIEITKQTGLHLGNQLIGSVFFFIPRTIWESKPRPTGEVIGDYLSSNHSMWFNNLSSPLIGEGFIDFGVIGVIFYAILAAYFCIKIKKLADSGGNLHKTLYIYSSFFIFFILRGALLPAVVYFFGAAMTIYLAPTLLKKLP